MIGPGPRLLSRTICLIITASATALYAQELEQSQSLSRVRSALHRFESTVGQDQHLKKAWSEYLNMAELREFLTNDEYEIVEGDLDEDIVKLSRVDRQLDLVRVREALNKLQAWKTSPANVDPSRQLNLEPIEGEEQSGTPAQPDEAAVESLEELKRWLSANRMRTWQQFLDLDSAVEEIEGAAADSDGDSAEEAQTDQFPETSRALALLAAEERGELARARTQLRRALSDVKDSLEYDVSNGLAKSARRLKNEYREVSPHRVVELRQHARIAVQQLNEFLMTGPDDRRYGWRDYLKLDQLENELQRPDWPARRTLVQSYQKLDSGYPGLEKQRFENARQSLQDYLQVLGLAKSGQTLQSKRQDLQNSIQALDAALAAAGETKEKEWKEYLDWELLTETANDSSPSLRNLSRLISIFEADEAGLELSFFTRVRRDLITYNEMIRQDAGADAQDTYRGQLELLARSLEAHTDFANATSAAEITDRLEWLRTTGYAPGLAGQVQSAFRRPNIRVALNGEFFVQQIADTQNEATPVNRCFEGAHVTGCARTNASYIGRLVPRENGIAIDILLGGTTIAKTTARQRRVYVYAEGVTSSTGWKRIYFTLDGLSSSPATADAYTNQQICGACVDRRIGRRLIGRFAQRRAWKSVPKAERMANDEARDTVTSRLDQETGEMLAKANSQFQEQMTKLRRSGFYPDDVNLRSTSTDILLDALYASGSYLGAPTDPPKLEMTSVVKAQAHETAINNLLATQFGGRQIDNEWLVNFMRENGLEVPDELLAPSERKTKPKKRRSDVADALATNDADSDDNGQIDRVGGNEVDEPEEEGPEEWSMTFDRRFPIIVRFNDEGVSIAIRGREFSNADQEINELVEMSAQYRVKATPDGKLLAKRIGDVQVDFVNSPGRLDGRQLTYKTFLLRKMDPLFRESISTDDLPQMGQMSEMIESVKLKSIESGRGWISAMVDLDPEILKQLMPMN